MNVTQSLQDLLAIVFLAGGLFFMFVGTLGVYRMPDVYHRIHAASKCTTLGMIGLLLGVAFHVGTMPVVAKVTMVIVFAFAALPVGSHILAKASLKRRSPQWEGTLFDEHAQDMQKSAHPPQR